MKLATPGGVHRCVEGDDGAVHITVRVQPGARHPSVGGSVDGALVVRVSARAVDGKATEAAMRAVADAFGVHRRAVSLVTGSTSRRKVLDVVAAGPERLAELLADAVEP